MIASREQLVREYTENYNEDTFLNFEVWLKKYYQKVYDRRGNLLGYAELPNCSHNFGTKYGEDL